MAKTSKVNARPHPTQNLKTLEKNFLIKNVAIRTNSITNRKKIEGPHRSPSGDNPRKSGPASLSGDLKTFYREISSTPPWEFFTKIKFPRFHRHTKEITYHCEPPASSKTVMFRKISQLPRTEEKTKLFARFLPNLKKNPFDCSQNTGKTTSAFGPSIRTLHLWPKPEVRIETPARSAGKQKKGTHLWPKPEVRIETAGWDGKKRGFCAHLWPKPEVRIETGIFDEALELAKSPLAKTRGAD